MAKLLKLTQGKETLVDDDTYKILNKYKWCAAKFRRNQWYAFRGFHLSYKKQRRVWLHHCIVGYPLNKMQVDHINGNTLDNRKDNLRIVTKRENSYNQKCHRNGSKTSRYIGVSYYRPSNKWVAWISYDGKNHYLGHHLTEQDAHKAYQEELHASQK